MSAYEDKLQALMSEFYTAWQKEENKGKSKWDVLGGFSEAHQIAVAFGNLNYQVENGGISQWIYNGYFHDDAEKLTRYLEIGAELDERCQTILNTVYRIDEYAQDTECDRDGGFYDEEGENGFIGDMINCDTFDNWYYEKCGENNWWQVVFGIIDKVEGRDSASVSQDERNGKTTVAIYHPLQAYIENIHDDRIGGFTIPLPTTMDTLQPFLDGAEITSWHDMKIIDISSGIESLGNTLTETIKKTMSADTLDELNYLAARLQTLQGGNGLELFASIIETQRHSGSVAEITNLTFDENLNRFDLLPAFTNEQYGEFLIEQVGVYTHEEAFNRLESSDDPDDKALSKYIEKLEKYVDRTAYGRDAIKEEKGVLTENGLLMGGAGIKEIYHGSEDIPAEYLLFSQQGEIVKPLIKVENIDLAATIVKLCAVSGDYMSHGTAADILKEITTGQDRDYLLTVNTNGIHFYPVMDAYKRGDGSARVITSLTGEQGTRFFAISVDTKSNGITGDIVELNRDAFRTNATRHHITPDRIDATMTDGSKQSYDLWSWANLQTPDRSQIARYEPHYSDNDVKNAHRRFDNFKESCVDDCKTVSEVDFIVGINSAYMDAASYPHPDMIRVANGAAKEILASSNADVFKLTANLPEKLTPIEAARPLGFAEHKELAVRREDSAGLDKWAKRVADKIIRQNERNQPDKAKSKWEEL